MFHWSATLYSNRKYLYHTKSSSYYLGNISILDFLPCWIGGRKSRMASINRELIWYLHNFECLHVASVTNTNSIHNVTRL